LSDYEKRGYCVSNKSQPVSAVVGVVAGWRRYQISTTRRAIGNLRARFSQCAIALLAGVVLTGVSLAQTQGAASGSNAPVQKKVEDFLRYYFALGPDVQVTVGAPKELGSSGLSELPVEVKTQDGSDNVKMYLTKDGRFLLRGDLEDLTKDPLAETVAKIQTKGSPVLGNSNAPITIVEFADFECPVCRNLHDTLRGILPKYPQVKLIFKDYPIDSLHPWARTAALAGRCAYQQDPSAFWKMYDQIYDNQDLITAGDVYQRVQDYAAKSGLNTDAMKSCLASPEAAEAVKANQANGELVEVHSTPTLFVNGRKLVGADGHTIEQYIQYELARLKSAKK
jgi:protein-disulfide isomerase